MDPNGTRAVLLEFAARRGASGFRGVDAVAQLERPAATVCQCLDRMGKAGELFRVRVSHKAVVWFERKDWADAFERRQTLIRKPNAPPQTHTRTRAPWPADAQPYYPCKADGSPAYRITVAPPTRDPMRTNTHPRF